MFDGGTQSPQYQLPEDALAADIDQMSVDAINHLTQILADYGDLDGLESRVGEVADDISYGDFQHVCEQVQRYVNLPNMRPRMDDARASFAGRLTMVVNVHRDAIWARRLDALHRSTTASGPVLPGLESKRDAQSISTSASTGSGEAVIRERMEQYLREQVDDALRKHDKFAAEQAAQVTTRAKRVRELYDRRLGEIRISRKKEFRMHEKAAQSSAWRRKCDKYIQSLEQKLEAATPLQRTLLLHYISVWRLISDLEAFRRALLWMALALVVSVFVLVGYLAWTNEAVRAFIDSDERAVEERIGGRIVLNMRQKPIKPSYENHYLWLMHQRQPARQFTPHELRDGFFEASWSRGRAFNVSVQLLEAWMRRTAEHDKSACVCAQHLGVDRFAVFTSNRLLCDPIILAETGERHAVRAVGDWLLDDYVKHGVLAEHPTYDVPLSVRIQYLAPHGTYAGLETTMQLIQDSVACVYLCGTLSRNPVEKYKD
jgi:hypothetical protein